MKKRLITIAILFIGFSTVFVGCSKDDVKPETTTVDSSKPSGVFTSNKSGVFTPENSTPTMGTAELGVDAEGTSFLHFTPNFTTETATGSVAAYLSTSATFMPDPSNGNPDLKLVGTVLTNGEHYFKLDKAPDAKFTHVILWCTTASIPFGNASLQ